MKPSLASSLMVGAALLAPITSAQQAAPELVGTWTSKSRQVLTGPVCTTDQYLPTHMRCRDTNNGSRKWILIRTLNRDSMIQSTTNSSSLHLQAFHTPSALMGFMKSPIIELSRTVRPNVFPRFGNPYSLRGSWKPQLPPGYNAMATWLLHEGCQRFPFT